MEPPNHEHTRKGIWGVTPGLTYSSPRAVKFLGYAAEIFPQCLKALNAMPKHDIFTFDTMQVADENAKFKKNGQRAWIVAAVLVVAAFALGIVIGHFAIKKLHSNGDRDQPTSPSPTKLADAKGAFKRHSQEMMNHHKNFRTILSEEQLENTLK